MKINIIEELIKILLIIFIIFLVSRLITNEHFVSKQENKPKQENKSKQENKPIQSTVVSNTNNGISLITPPPLPSLSMGATDNNLGDIAVENLEVTGSIDIFPAGIVAAWSGDIPPDGWLLCDGKNGTPNLTNRFIFGAGQGHNMINRKYGDRGGEIEHTLTIDEIATHQHYFDSALGTVGSLRNISGSAKHYDNGLISTDADDAQTGNTGGDLPHNNMPPFYVLAFIMKQ